MKNLISLFVIALTLVFTSCEKETPIELPENPYNYLGEQHNTKMTEFKTQYGEEFDRIEHPLEAETFIFEKIYEDKETGFNDFSDAKERLDISPETPISSFNFMNASILCDVLELPPAIQDIICPTTVALMAVDGNTDEGNAEIHRIIRDVEVKLIENHQFDNGYPTAMAFLAVAKYSADLNQGTRASDKPKWWQIVLADAAGAGLGMLAGGGTALPMAVGFSAAVTKVP
jgi:hypothetical protein